MVTPHFYVSHSFMLGAKMPHVETNALYDFSTHVVLPGNQLLMARLGHGGAIDGRCVRAWAGWLAGAAGHDGDGAR